MIDDINAEFVIPRCKIRGGFDTKFTILFEV